MPAQTSAQPGRRIPLNSNDTKGPHNKGGNVANGGGGKGQQKPVNNTNGAKENRNKKQQNKQNNKKGGPKKFNNAMANKPQPQQQQQLQNKEKQQNGNDGKLNEKDKNLEKQDNHQKEETKAKEDKKDQERCDTKKLDTIVEENKMEMESKEDEKQEKETETETILEKTFTKDTGNEIVETKEEMELVLDQEQIDAEKEVKEIEENTKDENIEQGKEETKAGNKIDDTKQEEESFEKMETVQNQENPDTERQDNEIEAKQVKELEKTIDNSNDRTGNKIIETKQEEEYLQNEEVVQVQEKIDTEKENMMLEENKEEVENNEIEKQQNVKDITVEESKSKDETENIEEENVAKTEVVQDEQISSPDTPPSSKIPNENLEKTPPSLNSEKTTPIGTRKLRNGDVEMEPLVVDPTTTKSIEKSDKMITITKQKIIIVINDVEMIEESEEICPKSNAELAISTDLSPKRSSGFFHVSGRKNIHHSGEVTESYRPINTELDAHNTNSTEVSHKRDRTPPQEQGSSDELHTDLDITPPKRARYDMQGFLNVVSSPLSMLRQRFSRASLNTPVKLEEKLNSSEHEIEVHNVSGISVHEEINATDKESKKNCINNEVHTTLAEEAEETNKAEAVEGEDSNDVCSTSEQVCDMKEQSSEQSDIKITETSLQPAVEERKPKNKRCVVM